MVIVMSLTGRSDTELKASIEGGDYWPTLQLANFIKQFRLPVEHKKELITHELQVAVVAIQDQLSDMLKAVDERVRNTLYQRAVFTLARAHIGKHFLALGSKETNDVQADVDDNQYDYWLGQSEDAVARLLKMADISTLPAGFTVEAI